MAIRSAHDASDVGVHEMINKSPPTKEQIQEKNRENYYDWVDHTDITKLDFEYRVDKVLRSNEQSDGEIADVEMEHEYGDITHYYSRMVGREYWQTRYTGPDDLEDDWEEYLDDYLPDYNPPRAH